MEAMASIGDLPKEILVEIFSWLPPQSLIESQLVCRYWNVLISPLMKDPKFVDKHLRNIKNKIVSSTTCLVFCCPGTSTFPRPIFRWRAKRYLRPDLFKSLIVSHDYNNESGGINYRGEVLHLPKRLCGLVLSRGFRSHCNGIICLAYDATVILWNPAINEYRTLPEPCLTDGVKGVGFGYDSRAKDYKIVRFGYDSCPRAEVYSLGTDSWREIGIYCRFDDTSDVGKEVFCKGVFYWFMETEEYIISFDMSGEVFCSIPLPDNLVLGEDHFIKLAVWNDSVALLNCQYERGSTNSIEVWVMDGCSNGVEGSCSWTKELDIGPLEDIATPLTFWKNDELLMQTTNGSSISFNLRSLLLRNLSFIQLENTHSCWDFLYVESLVSVQGPSESHS